MRINSSRSIEPLAMSKILYTVVHLFLQLDVLSDGSLIYLALLIPSVEITAIRFSHKLTRFAALTDSLPHLAQELGLRNEIFDDRLSDKPGRSLLFYPRPVDVLRHRTLEELPRMPFLG
jgi:hypothetical protein